MAPNEVRNTSNQTEAISNLPGALLAGIFLGVAEGLTGLYWKPEWAPALSVILMLLILVAYPKGVGAKT